MIVNFELFELKTKDEPFRASNPTPVPPDRLSKNALQITIMDAHGKRLVENMPERLGKILPPMLSEEALEQLWRDAAHSPVAGENYKLQGLFSMFPVRHWDASVRYCDAMPSAALHEPDDASARMVDMPFEDFGHTHLASRSSKLCRYVVAADEPTKPLCTASDSSVGCTGQKGACRISYHQEKTAPVEHFLWALWKGMPAADQAQMDRFCARHEMLKKRMLLGRPDEPGTPFQWLLSAIESKFLSQHRELEHFAARQVPDAPAKVQALLVQKHFLTWVDAQIARAQVLSNGCSWKPQAPLRMALLKHAAINLVRNTTHGFAQTNKAAALALNLQQGDAQDGNQASMAPMRFETLDAINALQDTAYAHTLPQIVQAVVKDVSANFGPQNETVSEHDVDMACDLLAGYCITRNASESSGFASSRMLAVFLALVCSDKCLQTRFRHQVPGRENPSLSAYATLQKLLPQVQRERRGLSPRHIFLKAADAPVSISLMWRRHFFLEIKRLFEVPEQHVDLHTRFSEQAKDLATILLTDSIQQTEQFGFADSVCFNVACQVVDRWEKGLPGDIFDSLATYLPAPSTAAHAQMMTCRKVLEGKPDGYDVGLRSLRAFYNNRFTPLADWSLGERHKRMTFQAYLPEHHAVHSIRYSSLFDAMGKIGHLDVHQLTLLSEDSLQ